MGWRAGAPVVVVGLVGALLSGCTGGSAYVSVTGEACEGFTPAGSRLKDTALIDAAVTEWQEIAESDTGPEAPVLPENAEVCVVYADQDRFGDPFVAMIHDDHVALFRGLQGDDLEIAHIADITALPREAPVIGVGARRWLISDRVRKADLLLGSKTGQAKTHPVDLARSRVVDTKTAQFRDHSGVLAMQMPGAEHDTYLAAPRQGDADAQELSAEAPLSPDSTLEFAEWVKRPGAVPVLASAVRDARGDTKTRNGGQLRLIDAIDVPKVGPVLLAEVASTSSGSRDSVMPALSTRDMTFRIGPDYVRHGSGKEQIEAIDPRPGWAAGMFAGEKNLSAYVVAALPPEDKKGDVRLEIAVGDKRYTRSGPLTWVPADPGDAASLIATFPEGTVVPVHPIEDGPENDAPDKAD